LTDISIGKRVTHNYYLSLFSIENNVIQ